MDLQDFLKKFAEEIGIAPEEISAETEEFGVLLHSEDFKKSETLGDIFRIVSEKKN